MGAAQQALFLNRLNETRGDDPGLPSGTREFYWTGCQNQ